MAGEPGPVQVVVTKPRTNIYTVLMMVATGFLLMGTVAMLYAFNRWYGLGQLFE